MPTIPDPRLAMAGGEPIGIVASVVLVMALVISVSVGALASLPSAEFGRPRAILFAPWIGADEAVARSFEAGFHVLRTGRLGAIVIVGSEAEPRPLPPGGWFALALTGLGGCLDAPLQAEQR